MKEVWIGNKKFWIDETCKYCKEGLKSVKAKKLYSVKPDYNAFGVLTHWHVLSI